MTQELLNVPKAYIPLFIIGLILAIFMIVVNDKRIARSVVAEKKTEIEKVVVDGKYGSGRGGIYYSRIVLCFPIRFLSVIYKIRSYGRRMDL